MTTKGSDRDALAKSTDSALVALCNDAEASVAAQAFSILYQRHKTYILRVASRYLADPESCLDVLQETFSYLLTKFPPNGTGLALSAQLTTLLYPVAKNHALNIIRTKRKFDATEPIDANELVAPPANSSEIDKLLHSMTQLSEERREVLLMRFVDDFSLNQISEALDIPLGTVKSRLHLGIQTLKTDPHVKIFFEP